MSAQQETAVKCPSCGEIIKTKIYKSIWGEYPGNRRFIYDDKINLIYCNNCHNKVFVQTTLLYNNVEKLLAAWYEPISDDTYIISHNEGLKRMLGNNADYIIKAVRFKNWNDFKNYIKEKEKDSEKADFENFIYMEEYVKRKVNELGFNDQIKCTFCGKSNAISSIRGTCIHCLKIFPNKSNIKLLKLSIYIFIYFLCEYDAEFNENAKLNLVNTLFSDIDEIDKQGNIHNDRLNYIQNQLLKLKRIGGQKTGGYLDISGNKKPNLNFSQVNGMVQKNTAYNLGAILLAFEYIINYENPKKWWQF